MKNVLFTIHFLSLVNFSCGKKEEVGDDSESTSTTTSSDNSSTSVWSTVQFGTSSHDGGWTSRDLAVHPVACTYLKSNERYLAASFKSGQILRWDHSHG